MSIPQIESRPFLDLLSNIVDNRGKTCPTSASGIALIATNCIKNDNLYPVYENVRYVSDETYKNWFRGHPAPGDFIFVTKGTPGCVCLVPPKVDFCIAQDMVAIRADSKKVDPNFLFAVLRSTDIQGEIENLHVGTLIPHFKKGDFDKLLIPLPKRDLQEYIGEQYFTFSAKIDLLHRQNKTLEGMAEALWRKMFVEEAKTGWPRKSLGDFFPIKTGKKDANYSTGDGQYPFFTCSQSVLNSPGYSFDGHAILLAGNGDFNLKRYKGKFEAYQRTYVLIPHNELEVGYLYYGMRYYLDDITMGHCGSVINFITKGMIENFHLLIMPDTSIFNEVCRRLNEINEKIDSNDLQIRTLRRLRDTLLPKLMSGEVRVK
jgi:type I restriction enzyme S subunit